MKKFIAALFAVLLMATPAIAQVCDTSVDGHQICDFKITDYYGILSEPSVSSVGTARVYFDPITGKLRCSEDGNPYEDCVGGGGGGGSGAITLKVGGVVSHAGTLDTIDLGSGFDSTESPTGEVNVVMDLSENVTGDVLFNTSNVGTIQANAVGLGTDTTGDFVATITAGDGLDSTAAASGEATAHTLSIDLVTAAGGSATTGSNSGLEMVAGELAMLQGCDDNEVLQWDEAVDRWQCQAMSGGSEVNDLEAIATGIESAEIPIGTGSNTVTYTVLSGDATMASTGVVTIAVNAVGLGTDTTGDFVARIVSGNGVDTTGASTGEAIVHTLSLNETEAEAILDLPDLQGQISDLQIADGAVDGGTGGEIADGSITADDLGADSVGASELNIADAESEIEGAIDTLANLTSIQSLTVTLADAGADAIWGWDDSAAAYENLTAAEALAVLEASVNILLETEIDASSELKAIMDDETGSGGALVFATGPTLTTATLAGTTTLSGTIDASSTGNIKILTATTLPAGCANGEIGYDSDGTTGQRFYICESGTWVKQGDGGGSASGKEYWWPAAAMLPLEAADSIPPISKDAGTNFDQLPVDFNDSTDECRTVDFDVPGTINSSGTVTFKCKWYSAAATTGSSVLDFRHNSGTAEGVDPDQAATTEAAAADAVQGTAGQETFTTWTETMTNLGWAAGDHVVGNFCRDANNGSDDLVGDARITGCGVAIP